MALDFLKEAANVVLVGPNGVGKSTLAQNIAHQALIEGHTVLFTSAGQLLGDLCALDSDSALRRRLRHYARPQLLVIDEVGYLSYSNRHADLMFELVSRRYQTPQHADHHQPPVRRVARGLPQRRLRRLADRPPGAQRRDHRHRGRILPPQGSARTHRTARPPAPRRQIMSTRPMPPAGRCSSSRPLGRQSRRSPCSNCSTSCATGSGPSTVIRSRPCCNRNRASPPATCNPTNRTGTTDRSEPRRRRRRPPTKPAAKHAAAPDTPGSEISFLKFGRHTPRPRRQVMLAAVYARILTAADKAAQRRVEDAGLEVGPALKDHATGRPFCRFMRCLQTHLRIASTAQADAGEPHPKPGSQEKRPLGIPVPGLDPAASQQPWGRGA